MAESFSELGLFKGTSPDECEGFVATIRRRALEQGKHRDNEWMAVLASSYLGGEALYWYEDLEDSIQNDWSRLRPALLARFGSRVKAPTTTSSAPVVPGSTPSATIPTPAAAPPTTLPSALIRKGRLKVVRSNGTLQGYVKQSDEGNLSNFLSMKPGDALLVSFTPSENEPFDIQLHNPSKSPQSTDVLAITWVGLGGDTWVTSSNTVASCCPLSTIKSLTSWAVEKTVWTISKDGELGCQYPKPGGGTERLQPFSAPKANQFWWARPSVQIRDHVRLVVEDAI